MVTLYSAQITGLDATIISVEVDLSPGLHLFSIVGLADKEIQESRERIGVAIRNLGARPPHKKSERLIVNLAPADIKKEGPAFDLPIALGYLLASGQTSFDPRGKLFFGELGLDGGLKPVPGALAMAIMARLAGFKTLYVPAGNGREAALVSGIRIKEALSLEALLWDLEGRQELPTVPRPEFLGTGSRLDSDFSHIQGQEHAKRALVIAAAGGHNVLMQGPPGTGKTMLARSLVSILPRMSEEEIIEVTRIYSVAGMLRERGDVVETRPFRSPHHTASAIAITGGGSAVRPGEITFAHCGVLFLDEFPEFPAHVLEALRQPLEDRTISIARAAGSYSFPADFILIAAMNPCPCGNLSNPQIPCVCAPGAISKYRRKISGPLADRIDLHIEVGGVDAANLALHGERDPESPALREKIEHARERQLLRFSGEAVRTNAAMTLPLIKKYCSLDAPTKDALRLAYERMHMSVRSYYRSIKLARTIADLAGSAEILQEHMLEALQYRPKAE